MKITQSAKLFQERRIPQDRTTRRTPGMRSRLASSKVHRLPLDPPFPWPDIERTNQSTKNDSGQTTVWPYGEVVIR